MRRAVTLVEVLVVLAVVAALFALAIPAAMKAREAALRASSQNNIRQVALALHNFASAHGGAMPNVKGKGLNDERSLFACLLPHMEASFNGSYPPVVKALLSPADPTIKTADTSLGLTSYAANALAFSVGATLTAHFTDGTANTAAFAEHYTRCIGYSFSYLYTGFGSPRRATFSDEGDETPEQHVGSSGTVWTFQVAPRPEECWPQVAQTPHAGGMVAAMADGSSRTVKASISPAVYWAAVTPNGGEAVGSW